MGHARERDGAGCINESLCCDESVEAKTQERIRFGFDGFEKRKKIFPRNLTNIRTSREASKETERKLKGCSSSHSNAQADNAIGWLFAVRKSFAPLCSCDNTLLTAFWCFGCCCCSSLPESQTKKRDSEGASTALHEMAECESLQAIQSRLQRLGKGLVKDHEIVYVFTSSGFGN